jgi:DNA-binding response OmpR family regulator
MSAAGQVRGGISVHIAIACSDLSLRSTIRKKISHLCDVSILSSRESLGDRCYHLGVNLMFSDMSQFPAMETSGWKERLYTHTDVVLLTPTVPQDWLRLLRAGAYDVLDNSAADFSERVERTITSSALERFPSHAKQMSVRVFGEALVSIRGQRRLLTRTEYLVFRVLYARRGKFILPADIIAEVWGKSGGGRKQDLYVYITRLREKLEEDPSSPQLIISAKGLGYAFLGEVNRETTLV